MKPRVLIAVALISIVGMLAGASSCPTADAAFAAQPTAAATPKKSVKKVPFYDNGLYDLAEFDGQRLDRSEAEWKKVMAPFQYAVLRQAATEIAYTGDLTDNHEMGIYYCGACGLAVFSSKAKFDSGTGWPSFYEVIYKKNVIEREDRSIPEETRVEVLCARCRSHLGHVFDDGPQPTGLRYCMNSAALKFRKQ